MVVASVNESMACSSLDMGSPRHDSEMVDLVFVIDCTASMGSYIVQTQRNISSICVTISRKAFDVRLALVEYRDHPPEDTSFVTNVHDFTSSVSEMKGWVDAMSASGGGDIPEAVTDGLEAALNGITYRLQATKICVLIGDAPPHGLDITGATMDGMPAGCPLNHDPIKVCREMAERGVILYCVGCEPSLSPYKDFFMGLSHITGGQYISLLRASRLSEVIINATFEEVENEKLMGYVDDHLLLEFQQNEDLTVDQLSTSLYATLRLNGNQTRRVRLNGEEMEPVSALGRRISMARSLNEVRELLGGRFEGRPGTHLETEAFDITSLDEVTPQQCERLVRRALARQRRQPTEHSEEEMAPQ